MTFMRKFHNKNKKNKKRNLKIFKQLVLHKIEIKKDQQQDFKRVNSIWALFQNMMNLEIKQKNNRIKYIKVIKIVFRIIVLLILVNLMLLRIKKQLKLLNMKNHQIHYWHLTILQCLLMIWQKMLLGSIALTVYLITDFV